MARTQSLANSIAQHELGPSTGISDGRGLRPALKTQLPALRVYPVVERIAHARPVVGSFTQRDFGWRIRLFEQHVDRTLRGVATRDEEVIIALEAAARHRDLLGAAHRVTAERIAAVDPAKGYFDEGIADARATVSRARGVTTGRADQVEATGSGSSRAATTRAWSAAHAGAARAEPTSRSRCSGWHGAGLMRVPAASDGCTCKQHRAQEPTR